MIKKSKMLTQPFQFKIQAVSGTDGRVFDFTHSYFLKPPVVLFSGMASMIH